MLTALLTPGNASNVPENSTGNADSAFPAVGIGGDNLGCYSEDDVGSANDYSPLLASHAKNTTMEVLQVLIIVVQNKWLLCIFVLIYIHIHT